VANQGIYVQGGRTTLDRVLMNGNGFGMYNDGTGFIVSYGNNRFANNPSDGSFTSTTSRSSLPSNSARRIGGVRLWIGPGWCREPRADRRSG
jgi:hypothetical protein